MQPPPSPPFLLLMTFLPAGVLCRPPHGSPWVPLPPIPPFETEGLLSGGWMQNKAPLSGWRRIGVTGRGRARERCLCTGHQLRARRPQQGRAAGRRPGPPGSARQRGGEEGPHFTAGPRNWGPPNWGPRNWSRDRLLSAVPGATSPWRPRIETKPLPALWCGGAEPGAQRTHGSRGLGRPGQSPSPTEAPLRPLSQACGISRPHFPESQALGKPLWWSQEQSGVAPCC